jgi:hypothetical protein
MARALQAAGRALWEINVFLAGAWKVLAVVEGWFKEQIEEKEARQKKYAALLRARDSCCGRLLTVLLKGR